jgi:hypothetical protein
MNTQMEMELERQWEVDHPDDKPCPKSAGAALRKKYEAAMAETRAARAARGDA